MQSRSKNVVPFFTCFTYSLKNLYTKKFEIYFAVQISDVRMVPITYSRACLQIDLQSCSPHCLTWGYTKFVRTYAIYGMIWDKFNFLTPIDLRIIFWTKFSISVYLSLCLSDVLLRVFVFNLTILRYVDDISYISVFCP